MRAQLAAGPTSIPSHHILSSKLCSQPIRIIGAPRGPGERHAITIGQPASLDIGHNGAPPGPTHPTGRGSNVRGLSRSCNVIRIPESAGPLPVAEQKRHAFALFGGRGANEEGAR